MDVWVGKKCCLAYFIGSKLLKTASTNDVLCCFFSF